MDKVIGVISIKGGVGKTTVAASLASALSNHHDKKVLLVDANYSAPNLGLHMDIIQPESTIHDVLADKARLTDTIHSRFGVDVVPGSYFYNGKFNMLKLKDKLKSVRKQYDFIILDSSPNVNDEILSTLLAADGIFIVSTPDYPTLSCSLRAAKIAQQRGKKIYGVILNKTRNPRYEISLKDIEEVMDLPVLARIPEDSTGLKALFHRKPISVYNKRSRFAKEIEKLSSVLSNKKESSSLWGALLPSDLRREQVNRQLLRKSLHG